MIFKRLFATFGALNEQSLELKPGLNIIEGENESGKSTWCAFLRSMLYGIDTRERDTKEKRAEKNRYRPWSGALISGRMELEVDGRELTVERSGTAAAPLKSFRAYDAAGDVSLDAETFGERMTGASREVFERSAFVSAPPLPSGSAELEARILATVSSGDDGAGYGAAESKLREWQRKLRYNRRGELPTLEAEIENLRREAAECREIEARISSAESELRRLGERRTALEGELAAHEAQSRARAAGELATARQRLDAATAERVSARNELPEGAPSSDELRKLERAYAAERVAAGSQSDAAERELRDIEARIFAATDRAQKAFGALPHADSFAERAAAAATQAAAKVRELDAPPKRTFGYIMAAIAAVLMIIAIVSVAVGGFTLYDAAPIALLAVGLVAALGGAWYVVAQNLSAAKRRAERDALLREWKAASANELELFATETRTLEERRAALAADVASVSVATPIADRLAAMLGAEGDALDAALARLIDAAERFERASAAAEAARATVEALENAGFAGAGDVGNVGVETTMPREQAEALLRECDARMASLRRESAVAEGSLGGRDAALIDAQRERLESERDELERRFEAIDTALKALAQANDAMRSRFSPALNAETAKIFAELTDGKYSRVAVSREFRPEAGGETTQLRALDELSRGTVDQLWLALRIAVARTTLPAGTPLVLDDAFAAFDDRRLAVALELLEREAQTRQVLVFTCHSREAALMSGKNNVNVIRL